jgi:hypothetical protein
MLLPMVASDNARRATSSGTIDECQFFEAFCKNAGALWILPVFRA